MIVTDRNRLGHRLRRIRTERGWTLNHMAEFHGVDKGNLSRIERGEAMPSVSTLRKLRDAYGADDDTFLSWIELVQDRGGDAA